MANVDGSAGELGRLLSRSFRQWVGVLTGHLQGLGVTARQAPVLIALLESDQVWTEPKLVQALGQAPQTVANTVARLELNGLVVRTPVVNGGRQVNQVKPTALVDKNELRKAVRDAEAELIAGLSPEQLTTLRSALQWMTGAQQLVPAQGRGEVHTQ